MQRRRRIKKKVDVGSGGDGGDGGGRATIDVVDEASNRQG